MGVRSAERGKARTEFVVLFWGERGCAQLCKHETGALECVHDVVVVLGDGELVMRRVAGEHTRWRFIWPTWILTVARDSLRSFPSSTTGGAVVVVVVAIVEVGDELCARCPLQSYIIITSTTMSKRKQTDDEDSDEQVRVLHCRVL